MGAEKTKAAKMAMPASGKIIRGYDAKKNQGIDIAAAAGLAMMLGGIALERACRAPGDHPE